MKKNIPTFKNLVETMSFFGVPAGELKVSMTNLDDIFRTFREEGVDEIIVDWEIMLMISLSVVANITCHPHSEEIVDNKKDWHWEALKIIREGKVDKFLGVKLYLQNE